jgi:uncharacterized protein involved in high-affinity Fe2+ transport
MVTKLSRLQVAAIVTAIAAAGTAFGLLAGTARGSKAPAMASATTTTGMSMGGMPSPVPIQPLGTALWQGMKIEARVSSPLPFVVFEGISAHMVRPTKKDDAHLMVMLTDAETGKVIPYGSVWATIRKGGKIIFDERLWPMISRYMGTHFGNNVALPGSGNYTLTLLIGPPQAARHIEYSKVWLKPHRVAMAFHWTKPK